MRRPAARGVRDWAAGAQDRVWGAGWGPPVLGVGCSLGSLCICGVQAGDDPVLVVGYRSAVKTNPQVAIGGVCRSAKKSI